MVYPLTFFIKKFTLFILNKLILKANEKKNDLEKTISTIGFSFDGKTLLRR